MNVDKLQELARTWRVGFVPPFAINPFRFGRLARRYGLPLSPLWPPRVQAGWQFEEVRG